MTLTGDNYLSILKTYNYEVYSHSIRTARIARILSKALNEKESLSLNVNDIVQTALFHDFGKLFMPEEVLNKPGRLTASETEIIRSHVILGAEYYKTIENNSFIIKGIMQHHEREDGQGYPKKLKKDEISIQGKILAIADVYDALASPRTYKKPWSQQEVLNFFDKNKYSFDKNVLDILFMPKISEKIDHIYNPNKKIA